MSRDTRMRSDDLALCQWAHDVWGGISRKPLEIETWVQRTTDHQYEITHPEYNGHATDDITWPWKVKVVTPLCPVSSISETAGDMETGWQWNTNWKWPTPSRMVTWPMTSRDPERSRSWPHCVWCPISGKRLEIETWWQWSTYRKWAPGNKMDTWPLTSRDPERTRSWPQYT